jgi:beta-galactosidase/beta-glucuronidase
VQLQIDCVLRSPSGCGRQSVHLTAAIDLETEQLRCEGAAHMTPDGEEHIVTLQVLPPHQDLPWTDYHCLLPCVCRAALVMLCSTFDGTNVSQLTVPAGSYRLWWPAGFASQQLYSLTASARATAADGDGHAQRSSLYRRIGFRTVRLIREPLTAQPDAETFYFEVNGVPTFMRGASADPRPAL